MATKKPKRISPESAQLILSDVAKRALPVAAKRTRPVAKSFAQRIDTRTPVCCVSCSCNSRLSVKEDFDQSTGKVLRKSVFKPVDRVAEMQNYSVNDFSLDNLLAIGAPLAPALLSRDNLSSIDSINSHLNSIVLPKNDN